MTDKPEMANSATFAIIADELRASSLQFLDQLEVALLAGQCSQQDFDAALDREARLIRQTITPLAELVYFAKKVEKSESMNAGDLERVVHAGICGLAYFYVHTDKTTCKVFRHLAESKKLIGIRRKFVNSLNTILWQGNWTKAEKAIAYVKGAVIKDIYKETQYMGNSVRFEELQNQQPRLDQTWTPEHFNRLPLPEKLQHCRNMARDGASVEEMAEYLQVEPKHLWQAIRRISDENGLGRPISYRAELQWMLARLRECNSSHEGNCGQSASNTTVWTKN